MRKIYTTLMTKKFLLTTVTLFVVSLTLMFTACGKTETATVPNSPQNFTATAGDGQVVLAWTAPENDGGSAIIKYEVTSDTTWINSSGDTGHTFTGLTNGTEYTFKVRAVNAKGNSTAVQKTATPFADEGGNNDNDNNDENFRILQWHDMEIYMGEDFTYDAVGSYSEDASRFGVRNADWITLTFAYIPFGSNAQVEGTVVNSDWSCTDYHSARVAYLSGINATILSEPILAEPPVVTETHSTIRYIYVNAENWEYIFKGNNAFYHINIRGQSTATVNEYAEEIQKWIALINFN